MNTRNRAWRRKKNFSKGRRKKYIAMAVCRNWWYEHDGQYIKGKIHCCALHVVRRRIIVEDTDLQETTHIQTLQK